MHTYLILGDDVTHPQLIAIAGKYNDTIYQTSKHIIRTMQ